MNMTQATRQQTLAAICATCPHHIDGAERPANLRTERRIAVCEITTRGQRGQVPIPVRLTMGNCPLGKFPQAERVATGEPQSSCGCSRTPAPTTPTGAMLVQWPRSAEQRRMWTTNPRTKKPEAAMVWSVTTKGVAWYGVPMPLRWWIMLRHGIVRSYDGCGCLVSLKRAAPWLDGPLSLLERFRLGVVAPACVWWHSRYHWRDTRYGRVQVENPAWNPMPGVPAKAGAWGLLIALAVFVALLGSVLT